MALDGTYEGDPRGTWCKSCKQPIFDSRHAVRVEFAEGSDEARSFSGIYHRECGRPFQSIARVLTALRNF
jgi:hypothetical protein